MASTQLPERVRVTMQDGIATVTLARADKYNGLDWDMLQGLVGAAKSIHKDRSVRAVILHGEGKAFCAGLDFGSFTKQPARALRAFVKLRPGSTNLFQEACWCWRRLPVPVIAAVHGPCYGGGLQIALAADFRVAAPDAELSVMEIKWGLIPDMTGTVTLRELLPLDVAKELAMTGRIVSGTEAKALGLVTRIADDPLAAARELALQISTRSPDAVAATKALFHQTWSAKIAQAFAAESRIQRKLLTGRNQRIAMKANLDKQTPQFLPRKFGE
jgi:enoyl-CoA hydratase/carnithine racemase